MSETCGKCGKVAGDNGFVGCPIYHGRVGDGFCPVFADGETALETATRFHDAWLHEARKNDELERAARRLPLLVRWVNSFFGKPSVA